MPQTPRRAAVCRLFGAVLGFAIAICLPAKAEPPAYAGSQTCLSCHAEAAEGWRQSDHALAWTLPGPETVLGDFNDASFTHGGFTARFLRDGDAYIIETEGPDGIRRPYPVIGVAGVDPLQQYLLSPVPGRTQVFDIAWDVAGQRWYPVFANQPAGPGDGFHWTGPYKSWEARCAECHATGYSRNYAPQTRTYAPEMAEMSVGCEACHGPGVAHLDWAADPGGFAPAEGLSPLGLTVSLASGNPAEVQQCLACHSRREALFDGNTLPGTPYPQSYSLALLRPGSYHADGQILDEVFEGGSFLQSKMYAKGVTCSHCHDPHSGGLRAEGDAVCTQCHSPAGNPDFPSLPLQVFDGPEHTFHPEGSPGSECKACHMIERNFMGIDGRRDHSFRIPRPDLAAQTGGPDACTDCHTDRDPAWAAGVIAGWYPASDHRGPHYGETLAAGRSDPAATVPALLELAEWQGPGIVRASAIELLPDLPAGPDLDRLARLLADPDPVVREAATGAFRGLAPADRLRVLGPSLTDPARSVRVAAAKALVDAGQAAGDDPAFAAAFLEWQQALASRADFPETHLQIGGAALVARNLPVALRGFGEAVTLDPQQPAAWAMIVEILLALGDTANARAALAEAGRLNPGAAELFELETRLGVGSLLPPLP